MWIFTTSGFYSVVQETKMKAHLGQLCVRAREPGALELLRERYMPALSETSVTPSNVTADYRYRAWVDLEGFKEGQAAIADAIDYSNFKSAVASKRGFGRYEKSLHEVWSTMGKLQPGGPYSYGGAGYPAIPEGEPKPKPYKPVGGGKKKRGRQAKLPTSFATDAPAGECDDCGERLAAGDGLVIGGKLLCREVSGCMDRAVKRERTG